VTPEEEEQVRRLLAASASEPTPLPDDVAARLDTVLADLSAERVTERATEPATEREARRRWPNLLVAAAAVAVVALGVGTIVRGAGGGGADSQAARSGPAAARAVAPDTGASPTTGSASAGPNAAVPGQAPSEDAPLTLAGKTPRLHTGSLRTDVRRLVEHNAALAGDADGLSSGSHRTPPSCAVPPTTQGERVFGVRLDGRPATLVVHRAVGGARSADIYACADASVPVATTRFRVP
jgi:hypothetical protein